MSRYDLTCKQCGFNKNTDKENKAYRWAGFHEGNKIGHYVEVEKQ